MSEETAYGIDLFFFLAKVFFFAVLRRAQTVEKEIDGGPAAHRAPRARM